MQDYSSQQAFHKTPKQSIGFFYILPLGLLLGFILFIVSFYMKGGQVDLLAMSEVTPTPVNERTLPTTIPTTEPTVTPTQEDESTSSDIRIRVLNGNGIAGSAGKMADELASFDYASVTTGNAEKYTYQNVTIRYRSERQDDAEKLEKELAKEHTVTIERVDDLPSSVDVEVIVGKED